MLRNPDEEKKTRWWNPCQRGFGVGYIKAFSGSKEGVFLNAETLLSAVNVFETEVDICANALQGLEGQGAT